MTQDGDEKHLIVDDGDFCPLCGCVPPHYRFCPRSLLQREAVERAIDDLRVAGIPQQALNMIDDWAADHIDGWGEGEIT